VLFFRILALFVAFFLGFLAFLGAIPVLLAAFAFTGWTTAAWVFIWLMFIWFFWRLVAFGFDLKRKPLIQSPRRALRITGKIVVSLGLIWVFWFGPLAPWEVILIAPNSTQLPGSVKRDGYFISYKACQRKLMAEIRKQVPANIPGAAPDEQFINGYCGQGCWPNASRIAESMSCRETWGARDL
jgi:hypothetical protein